METKNSGSIRRSRQMLVGVSLVLGTLLTTGCASTQVNNVAFVIEREAPAPSGFTAAIQANRTAVL